MVVEIPPGDPWHRMEVDASQPAPNRLARDRTGGPEVDRYRLGPDRSERRDFSVRRRPRREVSPSRGRSHRRCMSSGSSSATSYDEFDRESQRDRRRHGRSRRHHSSAQPLTESSETTQILLAISGLKSATDADGISIERNYFGSEHGKGEGDGEIGRVNKATEKARLGRRVIINSVSGWYQFCLKDLASDKANSKRSFILVVTNDKRCKQTWRRPVRISQYLAIVLLLLSGDVHPNPGPLKRPCGTCDTSVRSNQRRVVCDTCGTWSHIKCVGIDRHKHKFQQFA